MQADRGCCGLLRVRFEEGYLGLVEAAYGLIMDARWAIKYKWTKGGLFDGLRGLFEAAWGLVDDS